MGAVHCLYISSYINRNNVFVRYKTRKKDKKKYTHKNSLFIMHIFLQRNDTVFCITSDSATGWCFLGFYVALIITAMPFPNVSPLSLLSFFPLSLPLFLHHHPSSFFSQLMLQPSLSFFFCTLEIVLTTEKKKTKSLLNCSQCNNKLFILLVCTIVLLLFFSFFNGYSG